MKILRWFWDRGSKFPRVNEITQNQEIQNIGHRQIFTKYVTIKKESLSVCHTTEIWASSVKLMFLKL